MCKKREIRRRKSTKEVDVELVSVENGRTKEIQVIPEDTSCAIYEPSSRFEIPR